MRINTKSTFLMMVCISVSLAMTVCGSDRSAQDTSGEEKDVTTNSAVYEVAITVTDEDGIFKWKKIPPVELNRGDSVHFVSVSGPAWIVIPDGWIEGTSGGGEWAKSEGLLAFRVDQKGATVTVPEDYQDSEDPVEITYSVMARAEIDGQIGWGYVHGRNPPPRMIIKPR